MSKTIIYIGRSRFHRNRANLIQTLHTVAALQGLGLNISLLLPPWHGYSCPADRLREVGIERNLDIRSSQLLHSRWKDLSWFCRWHRNSLRKADGVHVRSPGVSAALAREGIAHNLEIHETESHEGVELADLIAWHREGLIRNFFPISNSARDFLLEAGASPERIHVSPSGYDANAFAEIPPFHPDRSRPPSIVHLGLISNDRGLEVFIAAARNGCRVTLIGDQADPLPEMSNLQHHPPIPMREVPRWYGTADIILLPYQAGLETARSMSPIKLFEAMAAGRPIVASDLPPIREILTDGENALLVPPSDTEGWMTAIERLRGNEGFSKYLADNARRESKGYTWRERAMKIARVSGWIDHDSSELGKSGVAV